MKNSVLLAALMAAFLSVNSFAAVCYSSNVDVVFDNDGLSVEAPKFICIKDLQATIVSRYSAQVSTDVLIGINERSINARVDNVKYLDNGYEISYTLLSDKDGTSICDKEVGYRIQLKAEVNEAGELVKVKSLDGYTYSTYDNCHDTSPETTDLKFELVR